jgi:hypothetical protein
MGREHRAPEVVCAVAVPTGGGAYRKKGVLTEHPFKALRKKTYRFFAAFFFAPLAAFFAIGSLLRISDSASDEPLGRHNWWAEPSTLIPDVDYG